MRKGRELTIEERTLESWSQFIFPCTLLCTCQSIVQLILVLSRQTTKKKGRNIRKIPEIEGPIFRSLMPPKPGHKTPSHVLRRGGTSSNVLETISHPIARTPFAYSWEIEPQATALPMQSLSSLCLKIVVIEGSDP